MAAGDVLAGLTWQGTELSAPGYRRVTIPASDWTLDGTVATATVRFPGMDVPISIDGVRMLYADGATLADQPLDGDLRLGIPDTAIELEVSADVRPVTVMAYWGGS